MPLQLEAEALPIQPEVPTSVHVFPRFDVACFKWGTGWTLRIWRTKASSDAIHTNHAVSVGVAYCTWTILKPSCAPFLPSMPENGIVQYTIL